MKRYRHIVITVILLILGLALATFVLWAGSFEETVSKLRYLYICAPLAGVIIALAHYDNGRNATTGQYLSEMLVGKGTASDRKLYLDYARVIAVALVIVNHSCGMQIGEEAEHWKIVTLTVCTAIAFVCNPMYVMMSGVLNLGSKKEEPVGRYYFRRLLKVVLPLVFYYMVFLIISEKMSLIPPKNIGRSFLEMLAGAPDIAPHFWLIYVLIALFVSAPFVKVMVNHLSDAQIRALYVVITVCELLVTYLPLTGIKLGMTLTLAGWEGVFILGYIILMRRDKFIERTVLILGAISVVIIVAVLTKDFGQVGWVTSTAPTMVMFSGAVLILLEKCESFFKRHDSKVVRALSKYSYVMILAHWYTVFGVTEARLGVAPLRFGCIGGIIGTVVVSLLTCFIVGFIAQNTAIIALEYIFRLPERLIKRK